MRTTQKGGMFGEMKLRVVSLFKMAHNGWLQFNYQPHAETGYYYDHHKKGDEGVEDKFTTEELFNLFKNKKPHSLRQWIEDNEPFK